MNRTVLEEYTRTHGTRFSRRRKKHFVEALHQNSHALGYESTVIEGKRLLSHAHSYLYGNAKQMKTVTVAPYDIPERKFWKKVLCFSFDGTKTTDKTMVVAYVPISLFSALIFGGLYGLQPLVTSTGLASLISCGLFLLTVMLMYWMMYGFHNAHNYNRNSTTIVAAAEVAKGLSKDGRKRVGFLSTDKNKMRFIGAEAATKDLANAGKNPALICLDCIAKGNVVQIGFNSQNRRLANEIAKCHPKKKSIDVIKLSEEICTQNAMACSRKAVVISCGELGDTESLCVIGTGTDKDHSIELETLDGSITMMKEYLYSQK